MEEFLTGAVITKSATGFQVIYQQKLIAEFAIKELAIMLAIDRIRLEQSLQNNNQLYA